MVHIIFFPSFLFSFFYIFLLFCFTSLFSKGGQKIQVFWSNLWSNPFNIHSIKNSIYLKFILLNLDINLIYILYMLWIGYPFSKSRFSKWIIQNIQFKFSLYIFFVRLGQRLRWSSQNLFVFDWVGVTLYKIWPNKVKFCQVGPDRDLTQSTWSWTKFGSIRANLSNSLV